VLDSTFNQDGARAKRLLRRLKEKAPRVHCHFEIRHELLDAEQVRLFAALPCSLQIGLQSASPSVLRQVGRTLDRDTFRSKVGLLNAAGVTFGFDLIAGLPGDSLTEFRASLDFALALYPNQLDIFPLAVLPGTALAARAAELQLRHLPNPPYTLLATPTFPEEDLATARRLATACDIFYSRGRAVAWFNAIVAALNLTPAALLQRFADWLQRQQGEAIRAEDFDHPRIWQWQRDFLRQQFAAPKLQRLLPLALDLVDYHYHYAAALLAPPAPTLTQREVARLDPWRQPLRLAPATRLARFHYPILDLLDAGQPRLRKFAAAVPPEPSCAVLFQHGGAIHTEALDEVYFRLLEGLDGQTPAARLAQALKLPAEAAREFLRFSLAQGIVLPT
ncbi:MAG TPA: B12-binding domain-containing radical SAM protein, partial [Desulfuromonas sp.]|nr:B12-binding domain-containing radical SAM protein [Desulfuromonas sp.]